jgi:hypothetical protein
MRARLQPQHQSSFKLLVAVVARQRSTRVEGPYEVSVIPSLRGSQSFYRLGRPVKEVSRRASHGLESNGEPLAPARHSGIAV